MYKKTIKIASAFIALLLFVGVIGVISANAQQNQTAKSSDAKSAGYWASTEKAMGTEGKLKPGNAITFQIPVIQKVSLDGTQLNGGSDRTDDFDFQKVGNKALMVGEIAVKENEVKKVSSMALQSGLQVTAIHNHLLRTSPHIMWIHISGYGDPVVISKKIRIITDYVNGKPPSKNEEEFQSGGIDTAKLDKIIGKKGSTEGGDYNFDIDRSDKVSMNGIVLSSAMDVSSMIHFQPLGKGNAAVIGEFALEANEVEPVIRTLTENGVEVTALHSHMLTEKPRLFYMHCWATGNAEELASIMRKALDETNSKIGS
jgi:hypothetical protein